MTIGKRTSYQKGCVTQTKRAAGKPAVWTVRYREDGIQKAIRIGTSEKFKTKAAARKEADRLLKGINDRLECITVAGLCDRYEKEEMPHRKSTSSAYRSNLKRIRADLGKYRLEDLAKDTMALEQWVNNLKTIPTEDRIYRGKPIKGIPARPLSKKTRENIRALVSVLFECAIRWQLLHIQRNPTELVRIKGRGGRTRPLVILTAKQYWAILDDPELIPLVKTMLQVGMCMGLRVSEILGLKWEDINFEAMTVTIARGMVGKYVDDTKTLESQADLPMHEDLAEILLKWKEESKSVEGWLFGNPQTGRPYHRDALLVDHLSPAAVRAGVQRLGWHSLRHTYRAMLRLLGDVPLEVQQSLMRHADIKTTIGYGGGTEMGQKREANAKVVQITRRAS